jgi:ATP-dependent Clp protease ATP-binding subunit ClpA
VPGPVIETEALAHCFDHRSCRPELLNRFSDIIVFEPLTRKDLHQVIELLLRNVAARLKDRDIDVTMTQSALDLVVEKAYQPEYGARPIRRCGWG